MRFYKVFLAIFLVVTTIVGTAFYHRSAVITSLVNNYLTQHNATLTCIDFTMDSDFDLVIKRLCIDSVYAEIELRGSLVAWQFEPNSIAVNDMSEAISAVNISAMTIKAKADIPPPENTAASTVKLSDLPTLVRKQFDDLALLSFPVDIHIKTFNYQSFSNKKDKQNDSYQGRFSISEQQLIFSLDNHKQEHVFSFDLEKKAQDISANISTDVAKLRSLLMNNQSALPASLSTLLIDESWSVTGNVTSQINWQNQVFSMKNQVTDFSFDSSKKPALFESIKSGTTFTWQTELTGETLKFDFTDEKSKSNSIELVFNSARLNQLLTAEEIDQQIINLFTDNGIDTLVVMPVGSVHVDLTKKTITSDGVDLISSNLNEPIELSLKDLSFNYRDDAAIIVDLQQAKFSLSGQMKIEQLQPYSKHPVKLNIVGEIAQHSDTWQLTFTQGTTIALDQLRLPSGETDGVVANKPLQDNKKYQVKIKSLLSHWQGNIAIGKSDEGVTFTLDINNQINQLNYPKIMQVNALELNTKLTGSVDNIIIISKVIADNVPIATAQLTGDIHHPSVVVSAQDLLLTDLLALKVKLPVELKLIDGTLDYHLTGQLKNSKNLIANPMVFAVSVQDLTGEVDGTWLQELNWQQSFTVQNGQLTSIFDNTRTANNLTIAKIETATPINNLIATTAIDISQNTIKLLAYNTRGNLLGGRFDIAKAQWPFNKALPIHVKLTKIDLDKLLELDKKQGIVVTGKVSGELPIYYDGEHFLIKEGGLKNVGDGIIQVYNNPAVEELKGSSTELKLAFDALENLHYYHLSSDVSMADDGYMLLVTAIKGKNPDLDNDVNLNLNLSYDLLGLLESLNITEHFENKVIKSLQK